MCFGRSRRRERDPGRESEFGRHSRRLRPASLATGTRASRFPQAVRVDFMAYIAKSEKSEPTGFSKILHLNWGLMLLVLSASALGLIVLYSVAGGSWHPWASAQAIRFAFGLAIILVVAVVPVWFWQGIAVPTYIGAIGFLILVELLGVTGMGARRWIDLGFVRLQPSEFMKVALVMALATYYDWLSLEKVSRPLWILPPLAMILIPAEIIRNQPDLGTSVLVVAGGLFVMFAAGVSLLYFAALAAAAAAIVAFVIWSRGTEWQVLKDYQYKRLDTFFDPSLDPFGSGYHITQSKIALGSGGWSGRGFLQGTQSQLNFLPEKHTDFVFTTFAEEFGFVWGMLLIAIYGIILGYCVVFAITSRNRYSSLLVLGLGGMFFLYFTINMGMVMGLLPVVGVPLPFISYGGSATMVLAIAFGLIQSAHVHRAR